MAKIADMQEVSLGLLKPYERNAKKHGEDQIQMLMNSIKEFGFLSPCLVERDTYNLIAGHGRVEAARRLGLEKVPCVFVEDITEEQRRAYIIADNRLTELGEWNFDTVDAELAALYNMGFPVDLTGFEIPDGQDWFENRERNDRSREEGNDEYNAFLDKFETPKTTDDCYTPDNIYEVVADYVARKYNRDRQKFVRPFYPNGDYQKHQYPEGSTVVDNPPFSILSEIVGFYEERGIPFFLFAPSLTVLGQTKRETVCAIATNAGVTYENGACVLTSFLTNLEDRNIAAIADPELYEEINVANRINEEAAHKYIPKYEYPVHVMTAAKLGYLAKHGERLEIKRADCVIIDALDAQKEAGKGIYGRGFLLSEKAAAEKAAAEKAAAEKAAATQWMLSERELAIIREMSEGKNNG